MKKVISSLLCFTIFSLFGIANAEMIGDQDGHIANVTPEGQLDVNIGDQTTPPLITHFNRVSRSTTLTSAGAVHGISIVVASTNDFVDGAYITLSDPASGRYWVGHQIGAPSGNTITIDTPLDFAFPTATTHVAVGTHEMANEVGTLLSPVIYSVRAGEITDVPTTIDITRVIFTCQGPAAVNVSNFCGITALTNGLVLRRVDGTVQNIFNVKTSGDLANIMYDLTIYQASSPVQGVDGFVGRLTFAGQNKMGVAIRIGPGEDLQLMVQDDITGLTSFTAIAEGHVVTGE